MTVFPAKTCGIYDEVGVQEFLKTHPEIFRPFDSYITHVGRNCYYNLNIRSDAIRYVNNLPLTNLDDLTDHKLS